MKALSKEHLKKTSLQTFQHLRQNITKHLTIQNICISLFILLLTFLITLQSPTSLWRTNSESVDTWVFQTIANVMHNGGMPYLDTFDHKGPLLFIINFIGQSISYTKGIWLLEVLFVFAAFLVIYKIARLFCRKFTSIVCVVITATLFSPYYGGGNFTEEFAIFFIAIALFVFLDYFINHKITKFRWAICGLSLGCVCLLRPNMISPWLIFCTATFFYQVFHKEWKALKSFLVYFCLGFSIIIIPIIIWLAINGALVPCFEQYILFNLKYSSVDGRASNENRLIAFITFCRPTITLIAISITIWLCFQKEKSIRTTGIIYISYFFTTLLLICISGQTYEHYGQVLVPAVCFPIAYLIGKIEANTSKEQIYLVTAIGFYILSTIIAPTWFDLIKKDAGYFKHRHESQINPGLQAIVDYIDSNTPNDAKISVYGNCDQIYVLSRRLPASKYSYQNPIGLIDKTIMDEYFADLERTQPPIIVVHDNTNGASSDELNRMNAFLEENNYVQTQTNNYINGKFLIYTNI